MSALANLWDTLTDALHLAEDVEDLLALRSAGEVLLAAGYGDDPTPWDALLASWLEGMTPEQRVRFAQHVARLLGFADDALQPATPRTAPRYTRGTRVIHVRVG